MAAHTPWERGCKNGLGYKPTRFVKLLDLGVLFEHRILRTSVQFEAGYGYQPAGILSFQGTP